MAVKPIPDGYPRVSPYLVVDGAQKAIEFYTTVLGATERMRMPGPDGRLGHAEIEVGDSIIMLADEYPDMGAKAPAAYGGSPVSVMVYVEDVDATVNRATEAGATVVRPLENQFYGDRSATFDDPFGHRWTIATHVEDVSPEEMGRRMAEMSQGQG
jgi:PhnB protein